MSCDTWLDATSEDGQHFIIQLGRGNVPTVGTEALELPREYVLVGEYEIDPSMLFEICYTPDRYKAMSKVGIEWHIKVSFLDEDASFAEFDAETQTAYVIGKPVGKARTFVWSVVPTSETKLWAISRNNIKRRKIKIKT